MKSSRALFIVSFVCLLTLPALGQTFEEWNYGIRTGAYLDERDFFLGVEATTPVSDRILFNPNLEWVFIDGGDLATLNADVTYTFDSDGDMFWWGGVGLAGIYDNISGSEFDLGSNVLVGAGWILDAWFVYAQAKALFSDANDSAVIAIGTRF